MKNKIMSAESRNERPKLRVPTMPKVILFSKTISESFFRTVKYRISKSALISWNAKQKSDKRGKLTAANYNSNKTTAKRYSNNW